MFLLVVGVEVYQVAVLVGLVVLDEGLVFLEGEVLAVYVLEEGEVLGAFVEVFLREHSVVDEDLQVVPFFLVLLAVLLEDGAESVGHFLGDVGGDFLHVAVALQIASAHVERDVWRVDDTMQQGEELRHDAFHLVGNEHLVAVELYLVALHVDVVLDAWEVEDTCQIEWEVHVEVNPEEGLVLHGVEGAVEVLVVLVLECAWRLGPEGLYAVDDVVLIGLYVLAVFPFCLLAESHGHSHELAVLVEQLLYLVLLEELLAVVSYVEHDVATTLRLVGVLYLEGW